MRGAATKSMSDIVEERQQSRCPPAAAPLRAAAHRAAGRSSRWLCCSLLTYGLGIARRSRLASGPGGQQQNVNLFLREPLAKLGGSITLICNFQGGDIMETKRPKAKMAGRCRIVCSPAVLFCARSG